MPRKLGYPRQAQSRQGQANEGFFAGPRHDSSRHDYFSQDPAAFNITGIVDLSGSGLSQGEVAISSGGGVINLDITHQEEKWNALIGAANVVNSAFLAGISSSGITWPHSAVTRVNDKRVTLTFPAVSSFSVQSADASINWTIPASAFALRSDALTLTGAFTIVNTSGND